MAFPISGGLGGHFGGASLDEEELAQLYVQYGYFVHRRCLRILRELADADDACQEVFIRVQRYGKNSQGGSILSWLYTIALRCSLDVARRRAREEPIGEALVGGEVASDPDQRATLGAALRQLDAKVCEIGVLHYLDGYTQEEVAARTGYSRRTIGTKLRAFEEHLARFGFREGFTP